MHDVVGLSAKIGFIIAVTFVRVYVSKVVALVAFERAARIVAVDPVARRIIGHAPDLLRHVPERVADLGSVEVLCVMVACRRASAYAPDTVRPDGRFS